MHTTHYSVVDAEGNAVATTTTINGWFGSGVLVTGAGFLLNNEMDDFTTAPEEANVYGLVQQGDQNRIEPGKRPLSSMSPTIMDRSGSVLMVTGGAGGPRIITNTLQVILNVIDHRMTLADAIHAPRIHHQTWPDSIFYEEHGLTVAVLDSLRAMGHGLAAVGYMADTQRDHAGAGRLAWRGAATPTRTGSPSRDGRSRWV